MRQLPFSSTPLFSVLCCLALSACDGLKSDTKEDDTSGGGSGTVSASFLTMANFPEQNPKELKSEDVEGEMNSIDALYANDPDDTESSGGEEKDDAGLEACLTKVESLKATASGDTVSIGGEADLAACLKEAFTTLIPVQGATVEVTAKLKIYMSKSCKGGDLSSLNGKTIKEIAEMSNADDVCKNASEGSDLENAQFTMGAKVTIPATQATPATTIEMDQTAYFGKMQADGTPCKYTQTAEKITVTNGCFDLSRTVNTKRMDAEDQGKEELTKVEYVSAVKKNDETSLWFESGTAKVNVNGWAGVVTYSAADAEPTWTMAKGSESLTGKIKVETKSGNNKTETEDGMTLVGFQQSSSLSSSLTKGLRQALQKAEKEISRQVAR